MNYIRWYFLFLLIYLKKKRKNVRGSAVQPTIGQVSGWRFVYSSLKVIIYSFIFQQCVSRPRCLKLLHNSTLSIRTFSVHCNLLPSFVFIYKITNQLPIINHNNNFTILSVQFSKSSSAPRQWWRWLNAFCVRSSLCVYLLEQHFFFYNGFRFFILC